jgi:hypothetical protein
MISTNWLNSWDMNRTIANTMLVIAFMDLGYVPLSVWQYFLYGYPDRKWQKTNERKIWVYTHMVFGSVVVYTGAFLTLTLHFFNSFINEERIKIMGMIIGISQIAHAITCLHMNRFVYGNKKITVPLYYSATFSCIVNVVAMFQDLSDVRQILNTWATCNIFIFVRYQYFFLFACGIALNELYTYCITVAGFIILALTNQNPLFYLFLCSPILFANPYTYFGWKFLEGTDLRKKPTEPTATMVTPEDPEHEQTKEDDIESQSPTLADKPSVETLSA